MPPHIRAFVVIVTLSALVLTLLYPARVADVQRREYVGWGFAWVSMTAVGFLTQQYWVFVAAAAFLCWLVTATRSGPVIGFYFVLLPALPLLVKTIPGIGGIETVFPLSYPRILILCLLVPILLARMSGKLQVMGARPSSDKYVFAFIILVFVLGFRDNTVTNALRGGLLLCLDVAVPYYVISRYPQSAEDFRKICFAIVVSATILAVIGCFEFVNKWLLYHDLSVALDTEGRAKYLERAGVLRTRTVFASPIAFGYFLVIGFAMVAYLRHHIRPSVAYGAVGIVVVLALLSTVSRGPWVGFAVFLLTYVLLGNRKIHSLSLVVVGGAVLALLVALTPAGQVLYDLLPFTGSEHDATISFRRRLLEASLQVIDRNLWLGSTSYFYAPEFDALRAGDGRIDLVNTYLQVALETGLVGLAMFMAVFASVLFNLFTSIRRTRHRNSDACHLGVTLFAVITAILVTLLTVSKIDYIPVYYWSCIGLAAALNRVICGLLPSSTNGTGYSSKQLAGSDLPPLSHRSLS